MKHELLAPAGNIEAGYAALYYGADAVYLGLTKYSARAGAENFTYQELDEFTAYAHSLSKKVYVAVNTILTDKEIEELPEIIYWLKKTHVDAVIIQDLGVYYLFKKLAPEIELHASTQMAVHNLEGAKFLYSLGFKRVVLARELTLREIREIAKALPNLDLEVFVHGALCYSYSGQCLFSALEYGKSANRGRCVYPCRAEYTYPSMEMDNKGRFETLKSHLFSMKDLALEQDILKIPALSLKIEGRKKTPLYVAAVTNYYRHILDGEKELLDEAEDIKQIFARPWCQFHFNGKNKDVIDKDFVGHRGLVVGTVAKISKIGDVDTVIFKTTHDIERHDGLQIDVKGSERPFGFGIKALYNVHKPVYEIKIGQYATVALPEEHPHISVGEKVYLASAGTVKKKYSYQKPRPKTFMNTTDVSVRVEIGRTEIWAMCDKAAVSAKGLFMPAQDITKTENAVREAFSKTGGSGYKFTEIVIDNPDLRFAPMSVLNDLRRRLIEELNAGQTVEEIVLPPVKKQTLPRGHEPIEIKIKKIDLSLKSDYNVNATPEMAMTWFLLPLVCRQTQKLKEIVRELYENGVRRFVVDNYYGFELLKEFADVQIAAGSFLYVMNRYAAAALREIGVKWATLALESGAENMRSVVQHAPLLMTQVIACYPPLFTSAVCVRQNDCQHCDRLPYRFPMRQGGKEYTVVCEDCGVQVFAKDAYVREAVTGVYGIINGFE